MITIHPALISAIDSAANEVLGEEQAAEARVDLHAGVILVSTWGYDQTNVDFFEVLERKVRKDGSTWVKVVEIAALAEDTPGCFMQYTSTPELPTRPIGKPMWRKVRGLGGRFGEAVSIESYSSASRWSGRPVSGSSYA